jgi:imidazolonepropionase-like amidohydrolase
MGVPLLVGTDTGFSTTPYGEWHAREMELFVRYLGYSPMDALVAMTRDNAKHLGIQGIGILEPGRVADVLVVDGDPLVDIRVLQDKTKIITVIKEGEEFDTSWTQLERREMSYERVHPLEKERLTFEKVRA